MNGVTQKERGWGGHFICAERCKFRRNTLLTNAATQCIVSTVGNMWLRPENGPEEIGAGRYYETMVFKAKYIEPYWDIDVSQEISVLGNWCITAITEGVDNDANEMHDIIVAEIKGRMHWGDIV